MALSTRDLSKLPPPGTLRPWCHMLGVLDMIMAPDDWSSRIYSFDPAWGRGARMFQMRNGSGDHMNVLFPAGGGAALRGFAHESAMSPWSSSRHSEKGAPKPWPGLFEGLPKAFSEIRTEPAFGGDEITFCAWWSREHEMTWRIGNVAFPEGRDPDGSEWLLAMLALTPASYARLASEYLEREVPVDAVKEVCARKPLTPELLAALNPDATFDSLRKEAKALGVPLAEASPPDKSKTPPAKTRGKNLVDARQLTMQPIGVVRSSRKEILDDGWDAVSARIELDASRFGHDALCGLEAFSHVEILFLMDQVSEEKIETGARHPRNNKAWPSVGILAQRGKMRPNRIGLTVCAIVCVEGRTLAVRGLDAVDGSPVLDIKPWVSAFGPRGKVREPAWIKELMKRYW